jgi:hypothetical protein
MTGKEKIAIRVEIGTIDHCWFRGKKEKNRVLVLGMYRVMERLLGLLICRFFKGIK